MATLSHSESRRLYSWWWDSHISPKNSKWLQENLTDMDGKVKSMIKLIEEDADSFARRAEMYYKKRPELMKLVEEFYRAYRALAERYNHATGELRHAQRTIAEAFPDQEPFELAEDSPSKSLTQYGEPRTPEIKLPVRALFDAYDLLEDGRELTATDVRAINKSGTHMEDLEGEMRKRGLKPRHEGRVWKGLKQEKEREESSHDKVLQMSNDSRNLEDKVLHEIERAGKAESEVQDLKKALANMQVEKETVLIQYQQCLEKLSDIEGELSNARKDSMRLDEKSTKAEIEVQTLKEALIQIEAEKIAALVKHKEYLEKISNLEVMISLIQEEKKGLDKRAIKAESEVQSLKDEISKLDIENKAVLDQYKQCLVKISDLDNIITAMEDEAKLLKKQAKRAETEVSELKKALADMNKDKEASAFKYKCCLETIHKLEKDLSRAEVDVKRLENEVLIETAKLRTAEENQMLLELSNQSLRVEADNLVKKIAMKDQELSEKQQELETLQTRLQEEQLCYAQIEVTLQILQNLNSQYQENQRGLELELKNVLQMLKDLEVRKNGLEEEIQQARDDNDNLSKTNLSSTVCMENMQSEIFRLREMKERLEKEVSEQMGLSKSLQLEILSLKEEIKGLNRSYEALVEQVKAAGLNPKCVEASLKSLQDENLRLRHTCENKRDEREILLKKMENMEELLKKNSVAESSLSGLSVELEGSHEKVKGLEESCKFLLGEKAALVAEKTFLIHQLQAVTENMHRLLEKNAVLENFLSSAKVELEGLREKSKGLEEICQLLKNERSNLLTERGALVFKLENVERRLESLEKKFTRLEIQYADLEKEKETAHCEVEELKISLSVEKQERTSSKLQSETRFAGLENQLHLLQEENRWKKNEFEEQLEKALKSQFEISILQKFMKDMEEKNYSLIVECQKHVEASKLAEKVISELESENLEQQVETELLLDEIERLRLDIYQVFRALETGPDCVPKGTVENDRTFVHHILGNIEYMKCFISKFEDDKQQLLVENSVLLTLLKQLESKGVEIESEKICLEKEFEIMAEDFDMVKNEKDKILKMNIQLKSEVNEVHQHAAKLEAELGSLCVKQADLHKDYSALQAAYARVNQDNKSLLKKFSDLKEEKCLADQQNDAAVLEFLATANQSAILRSFGTEKMVELKLILEDLDKQHEVNCSLENEMSTLRQKLELQKAENLHLTDAVCKLEMEMRGIREYNVQMKKDMSCGKESLIQTEAQLLDTEMKLEAAENLNSALCKMVEKLKIDIQESMQAREDQEKNMLWLSENSASQKKEIESLHSVNSKLESELGLLHEEIEEIIIREQLLSSELQDKNDEFELWESEAAAFYFDLQVSSIHEVLFQNKVQELTGTCRSLENESASKTSENELMKKKICLMENEIGGLKSELYAYAPVIASLREDIAFLEHNALLQTKLKAAAQNEEPEFLEVAAHPRRSLSEMILEDQSLINLQKLQTRIKAIGKLMNEMNRPVLLGRSNPNARQEPVMSEIEELKPHRCFGRDKHEHGRKKGCEHGDTPKLQKIKNKASEVWNGMLMKDIPLDQVSDSSLHGLQKRGNTGTDDQMLELWETSEDSKRDQMIGESLNMSCKLTERGIAYNQIENAKRKTESPFTDSDLEKELCVDSLEVSTRSTASNQEVINRKIHERLALNVHKLENLQVMVQNFRRILEMNQNSRKAKNVDFETVREQLLETEETVVYLMGLNVQLVKNIEESPTGDEMASPQLNDAKKAQRRKVMEEAQKGSERIDHLQLELQKIQYILLKLEDVKKNKGRSKFFKSKTVILRDFLYNGKKNSGKRKKSHLCGCLKPSTSRNGRSF